jgi:hypothetical protein
MAEKEEVGRNLDELMVNLKEAIKKAEEKGMPIEMILLQLLTAYGLEYDRKLVDLLINAGETINFNLSTIIKVAIEEAIGMRIQIEEVLKIYKREIH